MNHFGIFDYLAVIGTLLFSICIGVYYGLKGKQTKEEMLLGGRKMGAIPIAASMVVTYFSAITIIGYPAEIYAYGIMIYSMTLLGIIFIPLSTLIYVRVFYELKLTSVYEYLERRFDSKLVRWLASFTFILQVILINAVVLYAPAIALNAIVGLPVWLSVIGIGVIGTIYTAVGGLKAVIWTDVFQFFMIIIGMFAIVTRGFVIAGGISTAFSVAYERGRLKLFDFTVDPFMRHNTLNFFLGYGFTIMTICGTHQPQVQRYCSLPSFKAAVRSLLFSIPLQMLTMTIILLTGISIVATYAGCCPILLGLIKKPDQIIPYFVIKELKFIPGMMGIFVSCIFSAVLSSISSTINSMAAVTWEDFLSKAPYFKTLTPTGQAQCTKVLVAIYGVLSILLAFIAQNLGAIFQLVMTAAGATSGPLGGIFLCGLFIPIMNKFGAIIGILCGLCSMMFVAVNSFLLGMNHVLNPRLPTDLTGCPDGLDLTNATNFTAIPVPEFAYPERLYQLSYVLYPFVGAVITISTGVLVSIITGGRLSKNQTKAKYLHPWIREISWAKKHIKKEPSAMQREINIIGINGKFPYKYELVKMSENK